MRYFVRSFAAAAVGLSVLAGVAAAQGPESYTDAGSAWSVGGTGALGLEGAPLNVAQAQPQQPPPGQPPGVQPAPSPTVPLMEQGDMRRTTAGTTAPARAPGLDQRPLPPDLMRITNPIWVDHIPVFLGSVLLVVVVDAIVVAMVLNDLRKRKVATAAAGNGRRS